MRAEEVESPQIQCPDCCGEGKIPIGEHLVTREMALDAGNPKLEGSHYEYEYVECSKCEGEGILGFPPVEGTN